MDRRNFLKRSGAATLGLGTAAALAANGAKAADDAAALSAPSIVPRRRALRLVSLWSDSVSGPADHIHRLARRIGAATDGRWVVEIDEMKATGVDAFKTVMTGDADLYAGHEHAHRTLHPAFSYFAGLPCRTGIDIDYLNAWLAAAGGQELWDALAGEFNMKGLVIGHSGTPHGLFTRSPVGTRTDLHGKRIAVTGLAAEVLEAVDARPVDGIIPSIAAMSDDDALDGVELHGPTFATGHGQPGILHSSFPHRLSPGLSDTGHAITLGLRRSLWDGLALSERIMLSALASEAFAASRADALAHVRAFDKTHDTARNERTDLRAPRRDPVADELSHIAATIVADLSGHDTHSARINASYMVFKGHPHAPPTA